MFGGDGNEAKAKNQDKYSPEGVVRQNEPFREKGEARVSDFFRHLHEREEKLHEKQDYLTHFNFISSKSADVKEVGGGENRRGIFCPSNFQFSRYPSH